MKLGVVVTMFDEHQYVLESLNKIKTIFNECNIVVVHSYDKESKELNEIKEKSFYIKLSNLSEEGVSKFELPSKCISRNFSFGFKKLYELGYYDLIVAFTGDTLIYDATSFLRRLEDMQANNWDAMVSQAHGQRFHSQDSFGNILLEARIQTPDLADFACCFFAIKGENANIKKPFSNIQITNKYTSEQCLGDEMLKFIDNSIFKEKVGLLNSHNPYYAYSYNDGIVYHVKTNGIPAGRN